MSRAILSLWAACLFATSAPGAAIAFDLPLRVGWAVDNVVGEAGETSAAILHTQTGDRWWTAELEPSMWSGFQAFDVSARAIYHVRLRDGAPAEVREFTIQHRGMCTEG